MDLISLGLAAWRLAYMLVHEDGPLAMFSRLRYAAGVRAVVRRDHTGAPQAARVAMGPLAELLTCAWCVSVWTAGLLAIPWGPVRWLRLVLAGSAIAVASHEVIERWRN